MERAYQPSRGIYKELLELIRKKKPSALATIIEARGSTPQVPGAAAVFSEEGLVCGTVGGGSVEGKTEELARRAIKKRRSIIGSFALAEEFSEDADGICGGRLQILIDARPERSVSAFRKLTRAAGRRGSGAMAVWIRRDGGRTVRDITRYWIPQKSSAKISVPRPLARFAGTIAEGLRDERPAVVKRPGGWLYLEPHFPPSILVIVGGGHVGRAVAHLGKFLGFEVTVLDDRPEFAKADRFPEVDHVIAADIEQTLKSFPLSAESYVVIVTRGHRHDAIALRACIKSRAGYIGMIGSRRKIGLLREKFIASGWCTPEEWARVHTPIGLPIGSQTVEEIGVSIASELVLVRARAHAGKKAT